MCVQYVCAVCVCSMLYIRTPELIFMCLRLCLSLGLSLGLSVRLSVCPSVRPSGLCKIYRLMSKKSMATEGETGGDALPKVTNGITLNTEEADGAAGGAKKKGCC